VISIKLNLKIRTFLTDFIVKGRFSVVDYYYYYYYYYFYHLCGLVVRVFGYRSGAPGSIPGTTKEKKRKVGLERGPLSLVSTTEELLDRKVAAPV
jgi:hypothetical protein